MSSRVYDAINDQVNNELSASHSYLGMSGVCEELNFPGAAHWFRVQSEEERGHALRLFDFIHTRNHGVTLRQIHVETTPARTLLEVFRASLAQEEQVSAQIGTLYEIAMQEKDFAAVVELQWFVTEQVEEVATMNELLQVVRHAGQSLLLVEDYVVRRQPGTGAAPA